MEGHDLVSIVMAMSSFVVLSQATSNTTPLSGMCRMWLCAMISLHSAVCS